MMQTIYTHNPTGRQVPSSEMPIYLWGPRAPWRHREHLCAGLSPCELPTHTRSTMTSLRALLHMTQVNV